jgi:hypothetical protein
MDTTITVVRWTLEPKSPWVGWLPKWQWLLKWTHEEVENEFEVEVHGAFNKGDPMSFDSPGEPGYVEFEVAYLNGKPFVLTPDEKFIAEEKILEVIREEIPESWQKRWAI